MVQLYQTESFFQFPWELTTRAIFQKYPNPFASHVSQRRAHLQVLSSDVIERYIDPETGKLSFLLIKGILHSTRIFLKKGILPQWGRRLISAPEAYIIEFSTVNPKTHTMTTITRNISHTKIMLVQEKNVFSKLNAHTTQVTTHATIISNTGWFVGSRIEGFGLARFKKNLVKSMKGIKYIMENLKDAV